jgi:DHA2 family multidrug resistance protein
MFFTAGNSLPDAAKLANGELYRTVQQQATALAYIDAIRVLTVCCVLALPLIMFARRNRPGGAAMAH